MHITPITLQEDKDFMRDSIFYEFNIESEYIKSKNMPREKQRSVHNYMRNISSKFDIFKIKDIDDVIDVKE